MGEGWIGGLLGRKSKKVKKGAVKKESGEAANVFFASFLDTKKEVRVKRSYRSAGAKPHCYRKKTGSQPINSARKNKQRSKRSKASSVEIQLYY